MKELGQLDETYQVTHERYFESSNLMFKPYGYDSILEATSVNSNVVVQKTSYKGIQDWIESIFSWWWLTAKIELFSGKSILGKYIKYAQIVPIKTEG